MPSEFIIKGVANGKYKPLQDSKASVFLCETETFWGLWIARPRFRFQNGFAKTFETARRSWEPIKKKNETARPLKNISLIKILRDLYIFWGHLPSFITAIKLMFLGVNMFLGLLRAHFCPALPSARAKMSLSRAKNIFTPSDINSNFLYYFHFVG